MPAGLESAMQILNKAQIKSSLNTELAYKFIKEGFRLHANQKSVLPPVGQLNLEKGSLHIKYGMIEGQEIFVVKQATGFSSNWENNLPTGDGFISVYCVHTGLLIALLLVPPSVPSIVKPAPKSCESMNHAAP